jgi:hypothetical protein
MLKAIRRNDTVVTGGGIIGKVTKVVDDGELEVEIAPEREDPRGARDDRGSPRQGRSGCGKRRRKK